VNGSEKLICDRFSQPRMQRYLDTASGNHGTALALYGQQAKVSAALWQTLGHVEVLVRNSMHDALQAHSATWFDGLSLVFNEQTKADIAQAKARASRLQGPVTPGHVVAELNFGFWRFLLSRNYDRALWVKYLHGAFPHHSGARDVLFRQMLVLNDARNAVAHHQRIDDPRAVRRVALEVSGYVCPATRDWINGECQVRSALILPTR